MNSLLAIVVVIGALVAARRLMAGRIADRLARRIAIATSAFAVFLVSILAQGFAELVLGRPVIAMLPAAAIVTAICVAIFAFDRRARTDSGGSDATIQRIRPLPRAAALLGLATVALLALLLVAAPPRGFEVHAYHLPIAVRIFRDGTLSLWDGAYMHAFPANISVWDGFLLSVLPERLVSIANLPFHFLLCATVFALSRAAGADRSASLLAVIGLATIPIFGFSALELGADIGGVAFVGVATLFIATRAGSGATRAAVAGIAAGMAFGFKSLNLIPITALGLFLVWDCVSDWRERRSLRSLSPIAIYTATALAMMSFWLFRNLIEAGNPLYPVHLGRLFDLLGWRAAPDFSLAARIENETEWVSRPSGWLVYPWVEGHFIKQNFKHSSGLGPFFAATVPIVVLLWPFRLVAAQRLSAVPAAMRTQALLYAIALVVASAWWVLGDRQPRYVMVAIALTIPIVASVMTSMAGRLRTGYEAMLGIGILVMMIVLVTRLGVENGAYFLQQRGATRAQTFQYPAAIDRLPAGSVIANGVDREVSYALLGAGFPNRVVDAVEIDRRFAGDRSLSLTREGVTALGVTHLYVEADRAVHTDDCVELQPVDRLDRNPLNGQPLKTARLLFAVTITCK